MVDATLEAPVASAVGVLDDELHQLEQIRVVCKSFGACEIATEYREFIQLLKTHEFDAVSIDWELREGFERGADLLRYLSRNHPDVAKVVFTKHQRRLAEAARYGADFCLVKPLDDDLTEFSARMAAAARLGLDRRIATRLRQLGVGNVPSLPTSSSISGETERVLRTLSTEALATSPIADMDAHLLGLLVRRGWWQRPAFNMLTYARLPRGAKLNELSQHAGLTTADLATILDIEHAAVAAVLAKADEQVDHSNTTVAVDRLVSVLAYVMRLAEYRLPLMAHLTNVSGYFVASATPPPWDAEGLSGFLKRTRRAGISDALTWIRGH